MATDYLAGAHEADQFLEMGNEESRPSAGAEESEVHAAAAAVAVRTDGEEKLAYQRRNRHGMDGEEDDGDEEEEDEEEEERGEEKDEEEEEEEEEQDAYAVAVAAVAAATAGIEAHPDGDHNANTKSSAAPSKKKRKRKSENKTGEVKDAAVVEGCNGESQEAELPERSVSPPPLDLHLSSSPVVEKEKLSRKEKKRRRKEKEALAASALDVGHDVGELQSDPLLPSSTTTIKPSADVQLLTPSKSSKKRKKKNRQTSQEEESAQALLALNKGLAKSADNEHAIVGDEEDEEEDEDFDMEPEPEAAALENVQDDDLETTKDESAQVKKAKRTSPEPDIEPATEKEGERDVEDGSHLPDDQHFLVPADEDVEMAEAAMAVTAATASAALNATATMETNGHILDPASAPERTMSEHLAAHLAKVDSSTLQSQQPVMTDDMLVEHRLAVQLQQNGYAAPSIDGHGFMAVNQLVSTGEDLLNQVDSRSQKKRKRHQQGQHSQQPESMIHPEHGLMVDPQLMQLDETTAFTLDHNHDPNGAAKKRKRTGAQDHTALQSDVSRADVATQSRPVTSGSAGSGNSGLSALPRTSWKTASYNTTDTSGGTFSLEERHAVDLALNQYCIDNDMTMDQLRDRVWGNNRRKDEFWDTICNAVQHRSRASVYKHVRRTCHIFQQRAKWNAEEDEQLALLVQEKGNKWKDIGLAMGRMGEDCRDRYRNYVKCGKDRGTDRWSKEEENLLTTTVTAHKEEAKRMLIMENKPLPSPEEEDIHLINWTVVSDLMKNRRSRIQCRYKWKKMIAQRQKQDKAPVGITYEGGKRKKVSYDIKQMLPGDKYWLLRQIQDTSATKEGEIPWEDIARNDKDIVGIWSQKDLKAAYKALRQHLPFRRRPLRAILDELLQDYQSLPEDQRTTRFQPTEAEVEAATAASMHSQTHQQSPAMVESPILKHSPSPPPGDPTFQPIFQNQHHTTSSSSAAVGAPVANMSGNTATGSSTNIESGNTATTTDAPSTALDPVLMAGGALDELEKSTTYHAGLEAAARVVRNAMQQAAAAAAASSSSSVSTTQNRSSHNQSHSPAAAVDGGAGAGGVEGESEEEQELRRRLGGYVTTSTTTTAAATAAVVEGASGNGSSSAGTGNITA